MRGLAVRFRADSVDYRDGRLDRSAAAWEIRAVSWDGEALAREDLEHERFPAHAPEPPKREKAPPAVSPAQALASDVGNHAMAQVIGRSLGDGLMDDGAVHPGVEAKISSSRGSGASLDAGVQSKFAPELGDSLGDVRVHTDSTADALARSVSARAFATGSDLYFAQGEYSPGTSSGDKLLAHELTHVVQQRGAPTSGPMTVSQPGDSMETQADAVADELS
jgi:hypothetical protein